MHFELATPATLKKIFFRATAVTYEYDAWGRAVAKTTAGTYGQNLYSYNRLKYRGYYFDSDLGLYYLNSRFYDPNVGRFLSADTTEVVLASQIVLTDKNLYAYCDNNPVMRVDAGGEFWLTAIIAGAVMGGLAQYTSNVVGGLMDGESLGTAMKIKKEDIPGLIGATFSGALSVTGIPVEGLLFANAAINTTTYLAECEITGSAVNGNELLFSVGLGMLCDVKGGDAINASDLYGIWKTSSLKIASSQSSSKIAKYAAKKINVQKTIGKHIGSTVGVSIFANNCTEICEAIASIFR